MGRVITVIGGGFTEDHVSVRLELQRLMTSGDRYCMVQEDVSGARWYAVSAARELGIPIVRTGDLTGSVDVVLRFPPGSKTEAKAIEKEMATPTLAGAHVVTAATGAEMLAIRDAMKTRYAGLDPSGDGVDHINVYSRARSELGLILSNWTAPNEAIETRDGPFATVEGYWFWLRADPGHAQREELRSMPGWQAKRDGPAMPPASAQERPTETDFRDRIREALLDKASRMPRLAELLASCELPLVHYYVYGDGKGKAAVVPGTAMWVLDIWEWVRRLARGEA